MEFVSDVIVEINGQVVPEIKSATEGERDLNGTVKLMGGTGHYKKRERPTCQVKYVIPFDKAEFDFTAVNDGTLTIDYKNGVRKKYMGVYVTKIGAAEFDGEVEGVVKVVEFSASTLK